MKFSQIITIDKSNAHEIGEGHKSKVKVTELKTNFATIGLFRAL